MDYSLLYRAKRDNEDSNWYIGDIIHIGDEIFIHDMRADNTDNHEIKQAVIVGAYKTDASTVCKCTGKYDLAGQLVFQNDVIENKNGYRMIIRYGTYAAYCPIDCEYEESVGFYAEAAGLLQMPIGDLSEYARVIGNLVDTPELMNMKNEDIRRDIVITADEKECCPTCEAYLDEESKSTGQCKKCGQFLNIE